MENLVWLQDKIPLGRLIYNCHSTVLLSSKLAVIDMFLEDQTKLIKSLANLSHKIV